ncbi:hypothetical protein AB0C76_38345 [Kitasatospora sp. NPDC048722]|uniref:hypothetical protein n=1 Tax=Kitasatospora sp. NPDC048722 TaxID=3155639 RepID=UPI0033E7B162
MPEWEGEGRPDENGEIFLGGGPKLEGVDYEGPWLEARAAAEQLNAILTGLGLQGPDLVRAQAGWSDDGHGVVFLKGTASGARRLGEVLDRMAGRNECGSTCGE